MPIADLGGMWSLPDEPWSPVGTKLVFSSWSDTVQVFDASRPSEPPVSVYYAGHFSPWSVVPWSIVWSPDGSWILCCVRGRTLGLVSLIAAPATRGRLPEVLVDEAEIQRFLWAANGTIYYWDRARALHRVRPPQAWLDTAPGPFRDRPALVGFYNENRRSNDLYTFRVFPKEKLKPLFYLNEGIVPNDRVTPRRAFPDGVRFLGFVYHGADLYRAAVDENGMIVTRFWDEREFGAWSVSADSRYVAGPAQPENSGRADLYLADSHAAWKLPIENALMGVAPEFASTGMMIAYLDWEGAHPIHVGSVVIEPGGN